LVTTRPVTRTFAELAHLVDRVLAGGAVDHHQHLVRRLRVQLAQHAADLASSSISPPCVCRRPAVSAISTSDAARLRRLQRVERDRGRIGVLALRDHRHAVALAPGLQLRDRGGAEGVAGGQHQAVALVLEAARQLADGGGLADAVDADGEDHEGLLRGRCAAAGHRRQHRHQFGAQRLQQRLASANSRAFIRLRRTRPGRWWR
jgi:hypothetical protein